MLRPLIILSKLWIELLRLERMLYFIHLNEKVNNQASFSKHKWYKQFNSILKSKMPNCTKVIFPIKQLLLIKLQKINSFQFHFPIPKFPAFHFLERYKISISSNCLNSRFKFLLFPLLQKFLIIIIFLTIKQYIGNQSIEFLERVLSSNLESFYQRKFHSSLNIVIRHTHLKYFDKVKRPFLHH